MKLLPPAERQKGMRTTVTKVAALGLIVAACATGGSETTTSVTQSSSSPPETTTTTTPPTTTSTSTTSTTATTTTQPPTAPGVPRLEDGRPATWLGVTTDYEAVEVDTLSGEVVRSIGQVATAEDVETAECSACVNAIDAVWRSFDGALFFVSQCCEPAAGLIHILTEDDLPLLPDNLDGLDEVFFWSAAPSPDSLEVAFVGYQVRIGTIDDRSGVMDRPEFDYTDAWPHAGTDDAFPTSNAVWDGSRIHWLESVNSQTRLRTFDRDTTTTTAVDVPELDGWSVAGLAFSTTDGFLAVHQEPDGTGSQGVVFDHTGAIIDRFGVAEGTRLGGFDSTGSFLISVGGDGVVQWSGFGSEGVLAEGFIFASW